MAATMDDPAWKAMLEKHNDELRTELRLEKVLPAVRSLLTSAEYSAIENKGSSSDCVDELIKNLLTKDSSTFESFCSALEQNGYPHWASKLRGTGEMSAEAIWKFIKSLIQRMKGDCAVFGVLVVGETGSGKSTLINNLLGKEDVAEEGGTLESKTTTVAKYKLDVEGVPVALYDTPGLGDSQGREEDMKHLRQMEGILKSGEIHLVIYCLKLSETRMRNSLICMFEEYSKIGVKWEQSLIALTFADYIPMSKKDKKKPGFEIGHFFNQRVAEIQKFVTEALMERVGVVQEVAKKVKCHPTTSDPEEKLLNGEQWFVPLWLDVLDLLSPGAAVRFLEIHANNMDNIGLQPEDELRMKDILVNKLTTAAGGVGGAGIGGVIGAVCGGPVGAVVGASIGGWIGWMLS